MWFEDRKFKLLIEIDEQLLFIITKYKQFEVIKNDNDLIIKNFYRLTFDRLRYGDLKDHSDFFDNGELIFKAYK